MAAFVFVHILMARPAVKVRCVEVVGRPAYLVIYSAVSVALLSWVVVALSQAPRTTLWVTPAWAYPFAIVTSFGAFCSIGVGATTPAPCSVNLRPQEGYDPDRPGVVGWLRHPLLWGLSAWGFAHVPANGDWPSLVLFLGAGVFGILGAGAVERRRRRQLGRAAWARLSPGRGHLDGRAVAGILLGSVLWLAMLLWGHQAAFAVDPLITLRGALRAGLVQMSGELAEAQACGEGAVPVAEGVHYLAPHQQRSLAVDGIVIYVQR